jgi:hypothetical protein
LHVQERINSVKFRNRCYWILKWFPCGVPKIGQGRKSKGMEDKEVMIKIFEQAKNTQMKELGCSHLHVEMDILIQMIQQ